MKIFCLAILEKTLQEIAIIIQQYKNGRAKHLASCTGPDDLALPVGDLALLVDDLALTDIVIVMSYLLECRLIVCSVFIACFLAESSRNNLTEKGKSIKQLRYD